MPARNRFLRAKKRRADHAILLFRFFALVLLVLLLGGIFKLYSSWKNRIWLPGTRITVAIAQDPVLIASYDPSKDFLLLLPVPNGTQIEASRGFGVWPAESLMKLGKNEGLGGQLLSESLQLTFKIPVDAWADASGIKLLGADSSRTLLSGEAKPLGKLKAVASALIFPRSATNLSVFDRFALLKTAAATTLSERRVVDLVATKVLSKKTLPDGEEGFVVSEDNAKAVFGDLFRDSAVYAEGNTVSIINSTNVSGLATFAATITTSMGAKVVSVSDKKEGSADFNCQLLAEGKVLSSITAQKLSSLFECERKERQKDGIAQIELVLGETFAKKFNQARR